MIMVGKKLMWILFHNHNFSIFVLQSYTLLIEQALLILTVLCFKSITMFNATKLICAALIIYLTERCLSLRRNIKIARKVGLPYVVVPLYTATPLWYFCYPFILPLLKGLPKQWTTPWLEYVFLHTLRQEVSTDTTLVFSIPIGHGNYTMNLSLVWVLIR